MNVKVRNDQVRQEYLRCNEGFPIFNNVSIESNVTQFI